VPDMMIKEAEEIVSMWKASATFYVCGTRKVADGIGEAGEEDCDQGDQKEVQRARGGQ
jgi:sulfite reductase alpha subunit-like flavoprotein